MNRGTKFGEPKYKQATGTKVRQAITKKDKREKRKRNKIRVKVNSKVGIEYTTFSPLVRERSEAYSNMTKRNEKKGKWKETKNKNNKQIESPPKSI